MRWRRSCPRPGSRSKVIGRTAISQSTGGLASLAVCCWMDGFWWTDELTGRLMHGGKFAEVSRELGNSQFLMNSRKRWVLFSEEYNVF